MHKPNLGRLSASLREMGSIRPIGFPLSVEFGVGSLKLLQLAPGDSPSIVAAAQLDTPDDLLDNPGKRLAFQINALPKLLKQGRFKATRAVCAVPVGQMICKHLQLTLSDAISIEKLAASAVGSQAGCDPASLLVRCRLIDTSKPGPKADVICFAASKDFVARLMGALKNARLEPVGIHNEFTAAIRAIDAVAQPGHAGGDTDGPAALVLDLGAGSTKAMIVHGSRLVFARSIEIGARQMDDTIAHQLRCTVHEARAVRLGLKQLTPRHATVAASGGGGGGDDESASGATGRAAPSPAMPVGPEPDLSEPLEILADEASMCLRYHRTLFPDRPVEKVVFLGGQSRQRLVCEDLARRLRLPAQAVDPMARLARSGRVPAEGVDVAAAQPGWAASVGMCLSPTDL